MADCEHNWVYDSETTTTVTHRCTKCKATNTRPKGKSGRFAVASSVLVAAAFGLLLLAILAAWSGVGAA